MEPLCLLADDAQVLSQSKCFENAEAGRGWSKLIDYCCGVVGAARFPYGSLKGSALVKIVGNDFFPLVLDSCLLIAW